MSPRAKTFAYAALLAALTLASAPSYAGIISNGSVSPSMPPAWTASTEAHIGDLGIGSLVVDNGSALLSSTAYLGYNSGASGTAAVSGPGSKWTSYIELGHYGSGILNVTQGGWVDATQSVIIGYNAGAKGVLNISSGGTVNVVATSTATCYIGFLGGLGTATIDGPGSVLSVGSALSSFSQVSVGFQTTGNTLNIVNGGKVVTRGTTSGNYGIAVSSGCLLSMTVGDNSFLDLGTGHLSNSGTVRLKAIPDLAAGSYAISTDTFPLGGFIQTLGGTWNGSTRRFVATDAATGNANQVVTFNPFLTQRVHITDPASLHTVTANFLPSAAGGNFSFTASPLSSTEASALASVLAPSAATLAGWTFAAPNYTPGNPVFLSLDVGPGYANDLAIWHYDSTTLTWASYTPTDLSYDGTYANFTVTGFSGYAVSTLPEPASLVLLALGAAALLARRRRG